MNGRIQIRVNGQPIPQGSKTANRHGPGVRDANATRLKPWRTHVTATATDTCRYHDTITGPIRLWAWFTFTRPAAHYFTGRNAHRLRPGAPPMPTGRGLGDVDKLLRAILDSLTDAHVWTDDSQVVDARARKVWSGEDERALPNPGVIVVLEPYDLGAPLAPVAAADSPYPAATGPRTAVPVAGGEATTGTASSTQAVL